MAISKRIEVIPQNGDGRDGGSYFVSLEEAKRLTASGQARWRDRSAVLRERDVSRRSAWVPRVSGLCGHGPLVLQMV